MANYLFTLQPTFTQGFVFGQISILFLLALILKYLFWNSGPEPALVSLPPHTKATASYVDEKLNGFAYSKELLADGESMEWLNLLLLQAVQTYRRQFREHLTGLEGDELVRQKIEAKLNEARPANFTDPIRVHSVNLGTSSPRLSRAQVQNGTGDTNELASRGSITITAPATNWLILQMTRFTAFYQDTLSISLSTSIVLHYPQPFFARLPVALTLSLDVFASDLLLIPPNPDSQDPSLTFILPPDFSLEIRTNSLLGSRAKLADVPKVHEMIQSQIRRFLVQRGTWTIFLPKISTSRPT